MSINQKGIAHIFVLLVLVAGVIGGLVLIKNPAIFTPRASEEIESQSDANVCDFKVKEIKGEDPCSLGSKWVDGKLVEEGSTGYKFYKIKCADGYELRIGDDSRCVSQSALDLTSSNFCQNHSSCTNLNKSDPRTALGVSLGYGNNTSLSFDPISGTDEVAVIHTAVWPGAKSEQEAKSGNITPIYQGFGGTRGGTRAITHPAYIEYYAVDKKEHQEILNKRVISSFPRIIEVTKTLYSNATNSIVPIEKTPIASIPVQLGSEENISSPAKFSYLAPGQYDLKYYIPKGYTADTLEWCLDSICKVITLESDQSANADNSRNRYGSIKVAAPHDEGKTATVKINYGTTKAGQSPSPVTDGKKPDIFCDVANNRAILKSIPEKTAFNIDLRVNNMKDEWDGKCITSAPGDFCADKLKNELTRGYPFRIEPNQKYDLWYTIRSSENTEKISKHYSFTCKSPAVVCAPGGNKATISFASENNAIGYATRLDNQNNAWDGLCKNEGGDFCNNNLINPTGTYDITPGASYKFWYHPKFVNNQLGNAISTTFICPANASPTKEIKALTAEEENTGLTIPAIEEY